MACCSCSQPSRSHAKNPFLLTSSLLLGCPKMSRAENKAHGSLPSACCLLFHQQLLPSICLYHFWTQPCSNLDHTVCPALSLHPELTVLPLPSSAPFSQLSHLPNPLCSESSTPSVPLAQFSSSLLNNMAMASLIHTSRQGCVHPVQHLLKGQTVAAHRLNNS